MKKGVLFFAHDTEHTTYTNLAIWNAKRVNRCLDLPVTLITNNPSVDDTVFDRVILQNNIQQQTRFFHDLGHTSSWANLDRHSAFELSPYHETLVLDCDYVIASSDLAKLFSAGQDFLSFDRAFDVTNLRSDVDVNRFGGLGMPMSWATVMYFKKSHSSEMIFYMLRMIKEHWSHYRHIYAVQPTNFRNDFALAVALNTVNGHLGRWPSIPWAMAAVEPQHSITQIDIDSFRVDFLDQKQKPKHTVISKQDVHAMCKQSLLRLVAHDC